MPWVFGAKYGVPAPGEEEEDNQEAPREHRLFKGSERVGAEVALQELGDLQLVKLGGGDTRGCARPADGDGLELIFDVFLVAISYY